MKDIRRILHILHGFVRLFGFAPFNDNGKLSSWYLVTLSYSATYFIAGVHLWSYILFSRRTYYLNRPFQFFLMICVDLAGVVCELANVMRFRNPYRLQDFLRTENTTRLVIDYDVWFLMIDVILISITGVLAELLWFCGSFQQSVPAGYLFASFLSRQMSEIRMYVGLVYVSYLLRILKQQMRSLSTAGIQSLSPLDHLIQCCSAISRSYRLQIGYYVWKNRIRTMWGLVFLHELAVSRDKRYSSIPVMLVAYSLFLKMYVLWNFCASYQSVHNTVKSSVFKSFIGLRSRKYALNITMNAHLISKPRFNDSVGGYFTPNKGYWVKIVGSIQFFYLMMVQMNAVEPLFLETVGVKRDFNRSEQSEFDNGDTNKS